MPAAPPDKGRQGALKHGQPVRGEQEGQDAMTVEGQKGGTAERQRSKGAPASKPQVRGAVDVMAKNKHGGGGIISRHGTFYENRKDFVCIKSQMKNKHELSDSS